jgi:hypothetical protein
VILCIFRVARRPSQPWLGVTGSPLLFHWDHANRAVPFEHHRVNLGRAAQSLIACHFHDIVVVDAHANHRVSAPLSAFIRISGTPSRILCIRFE